MAFDKKQTYNGQDTADKERDDDSQDLDGNGDQEVVADIEQKHKEDRELCAKEVANLHDICKSLAADFENYKKRVERDRIAWTQSARAELLRDLLPVIDDFDRALSEYHKKEPVAYQESWIAGFELIRKAFDKFLHTYGVTAIDQMVTFDPELHEALAHVESATHESGQIVDVVQKGYMLNGTVLRVARVTVAK